MEKTPTRELLSAVVFTAENFDDAFKKAPALGRAEEITYSNQDALQVSWRLAEITTIDALGEVPADGREVYCEPRPLPAGSPINLKVAWKPEESRPTQSGV